MNTPFRKPQKEMSTLSVVFSHHLVPFGGIYEAMSYSREDEEEAPLTIKAI